MSQYLHPDEMGKIEPGFRPREVRRWKKLAWEFGWDFKTIKIGEKLWLIEMSNEVDGERVTTRLENPLEISRWWILTIKLPTVKAEESLYDMIYDLEDAPREWPYEETDES